MYILYQECVKNKNLNYYKIWFDQESIVIATKIK